MSECNVCKGDKNVPFICPVCRDKGQTRAFNPLLDNPEFLESLINRLWKYYPSELRKTKEGQGYYNALKDIYCRAAFPTVNEPIQDYCPGCGNHLYLKGEKNG